MRSAWTLLVVLLVLTVSGCQKVDINENRDLTADPRTWEIEGPQSEQTVTVKVSAEKDVTISIAIYNKVDDDDIKMLVEKEGKKNVEVSTKVPAKQKYYVEVKSPKEDTKADVSIKAE